METTRGFRLWGLVQMRTFGLGVSSQWSHRFCGPNAGSPLGLRGLDWVKVKTFGFRA